MSYADGRKPTSMLGAVKSLNFDSLTHQMRRNLVDPRVPEVLKNIAALLNEEKNVLLSMQNLAQEQREASKNMLNWGRDDLDDIKDITEKMAALTEKVADVEVVWSERYEHYRSLLKQIRDAESRLTDPRDRKRRIKDEMVKLQKSHPKSPRIKELEADIQQISRETLADELEAGNVKRQKLREALFAQLNAMFEAAQKLCIIAGFGWYVAGQIDTSPVPVGAVGRPKYEGEQITAQALRDCQVQLHRWQPPPNDIYPMLPTLTNTAPALLEQQKQEYESKLAHISSQHAQVKQAYDQQSRSIEEMTDALASQKTGFESQLDDLAGALRTEREKHEAEVAQLKHMLEEKSTALEAERQKCEAQARDLHNISTQQRDFEVQLRERDSIISRLQADMNAVATEKGKLAQVVKDLEETLKNKSGTLEQKEEKIGKLEDDISAIKSQLSGLKLSPAAPASAPAAVAAAPSSAASAAPSSSAAPDPAAAAAPGAAAARGPTSPPSGTPDAAGTAAAPPPPSPANPHQPMNAAYGPVPGYGQQPPPQGYYGQQQPFYGQQQQQQQQQQYYDQGAYYGPEYGYQQGYQQNAPPPAGYQQQGGPPGGSSFVGGFFLGPPDEAPPAYDGPSEGYKPDKKEKD